MRTLALALLLVIAGCTAPPDPARSALFRAQVEAAADGDRTAAARVVGGLAAAQTGISLGCTLLNDLAAWGVLEGLRRYCFAGPRGRRQPG